MMLTASAPMVTDDASAGAGVGGSGLPAVQPTKIC